MAADLTCTELDTEAPNARAFRLAGSLTSGNTQPFIEGLRESLQPQPKRVFFDIRELERIDRAGMDLLIGLAGYMDDGDGGFLAVIGASDELRERLHGEAPFRFFRSFGQAAAEVLDSVLARLSGQFRALPEAPDDEQTTEYTRTVWREIRPAGPGVQVLSLAGSFDKHSAPHFERHWKSELADDTRHLVLEVGELRSVIDEGKDWLQRMAETLRERGGRVTICNARPKVRVMMDMLDMARMFEFSVSVKEATGE
jgi:anti-anti-sigma factor